MVGNRVLLLHCSGDRRAGAAPRGGIGLVSDGCCCCSAVVLGALVLLLAGTSAWLANGGCCCCGAVVRVALVLLLAETSAWLTMAAAAVVQWCVSRWCCSSRGHRLDWRWVLLCSAAVVLVALVPLLAETPAWWATGAAAVVQWCSSRWCFSSRRHQLSGRCGAAAVVQWCSSRWCCS